ncbi:uncharacterized protein [Watersipora subatra]|uniref:uncharacterized protein isoform X4 n=1 Tax=Watersipora subatra TaxID=2589382 RepID=UPI00355C707E
MSTTTTTYKEMAVPAHLEGGRTINQYITSEDGSVKIPAMMVDADMFYEELKCYKLNMDDVLLRRFTKMRDMIEQQVVDMENMMLSELIEIYLYADDMPSGNFFEFVEYIWKMKDQPTHSPRLF